MRSLLAIAAAATLLAGCAGPNRTPDDLIRGGYASPDGAAFLGYHGPVYRQGSAERGN